MASMRIFRSTPRSAALAPIRIHAGSGSVKPSSRAALARAAASPRARGALFRPAVLVRAVSAALAEAAISPSARGALSRPAVLMSTASKIHTKL